MNIAIKVMDGVLGRPAEGIAVSIASQSDGVHAELARGFTDSSGRFGFAPREAPVGENYRIELDVDRYYASLGIVASYKKATVVLRVPDPGADHQILTLVTPVGHAMWSSR